MLTQPMRHLLNKYIFSRNIKIWITYNLNQNINDTYKIWISKKNEYYFFIEITRTVKISTKRY